MLCFKDTIMITSIGEDAEKLEPSFTADEIAKW